MKIVIAGGGTGGHLFPGIAIAEEFMRRDRTSEVIFVGTKTGIEKDMVPKAGFTLRTITFRGMKGSYIQRMITVLFKLPASMIQSMTILLMYKPDVVIGMGGYASFPPILTANLLRMPAVIHEQNIIPGAANTILAKFVKRIAVSFHESVEYFSKHKTVVTGNPVRRAFMENAVKEKKKDGVFTVFISGGSQGASSINLSMMGALEFMSDIKDSIRIIHQTGKKDFDVVRRGYDKKGFSSEVYPFIQDMAECYRKSDMVICRAGATTIAELALCGKPSILIPYPFAAHNHQEKNAAIMKEKGAADMIPDREMNGKVLADNIRRCIHDPVKMKKMAEQSKKSGRADAAEKIVDMCYQLVQG